MKRLLAGALAALLLLLSLPCAAGFEARAEAAKDKTWLMAAGDVRKLGAKLGGMPCAKIEWSSSDEAVVTAAKARVQAHAAGRATLTASCAGKSLRCDVVVLPKKLTLKLGEKISLPRSGSEKYFVENAAIASVSKKGVVSGKRAGSTRLGVALGKQRAIVKLKIEGSKQSAAAGLECADEAEQIVLVNYKGGSAARLSLHEKLNGLWRKIYACAACVGRNGIGKTREGDGKTPVGTYNLTQPFGIKADPGAQMSYTKVTRYHYWCGDSSSKYYNQLVDERQADRKHTSSDEYLINYKGVYNYCMFIDYNAKGEAGKGSCIFLHCKGSKDSTAGCIAVDQAVMKKIIQWAKPGCKIVIQ